jgi:hypothetical protein
MDYYSLQHPHQFLAFGAVKKQFIFSVVHDAAHLYHGPTQVLLLEHSVVAEPLASLHAKVQKVRVSERTMETGA